MSCTEKLAFKGDYARENLTEDGLKQSIEYYKQAIEKDPNFAPAYVGLVFDYNLLGITYWPPRDAFPYSEFYARKALEIDDTYSDAHAAMATVRLFYDWDWAEAEKELMRALTLNPNSVGAHAMYSYYWNMMGQPDKSLADIKRSLEHASLSPLANTDCGTAYYYGRQYDEAIAQLEKTVELGPRFYRSYLWLGQSYEQKGMHEQAIATFQKGMTQAGRHPQLLASLGHAYATAGERDKALKVLDELREMSKQHYVSPYLFAVVYTGLGDKDQAFAWLDKAVQDRCWFLIWLRVEPQFDPLRDDPRFQGVLARVGLAPPQNPG